MRIATSQGFDRPLSLMQQLTAKADNVQMQIATGKKLVAPSGDAGAYIQLQSLQRSVANDGAYSTNIAMAQGVLAQADTALESIETQLQRVRELVTKAASGTNSDIDRKAIATELDSIRDELFGLANSRDVRGQPIFGGASGDAAYAKAPDGAISYAGEGTPGGIPIGDGVTIQGGVSGPQVFASGASDIFAVLDTLSTALKTGSATAAATETLSAITATEGQVSLARSSVGARAVRLELADDAMTETAAVRESARASIEDTDITTAVTELQKTLTILQATQASFTKLSSLSLFDYLR